MTTPPRSAEDIMATLKAQFPKEEGKATMAKVKVTETKPAQKKPATKGAAGKPVHELNAQSLEILRVNQNVKFTRQNFISVISAAMPGAVVHAALAQIAAVCSGALFQGHSGPEAVEKAWTEAVFSFRTTAGTNPSATVSVMVAEAEPAGTKFNMASVRFPVQIQADGTALWLTDRAKLSSPVKVGVVKRNVVTEPPKALPKEVAPARKPRAKKAVAAPVPVEAATTQVASQQKTKTLPDGAQVVSGVPGMSRLLHAIQREGEHISVYLTLTQEPRFDAIVGTVRTAYAWLNVTPAMEGRLEQTIERLLSRIAGHGQGVFMLLVSREHSTLYRNTQFSVSIVDTREPSAVYGYAGVFSGGVDYGRTPPLFGIGKCSNLNDVRGQVLTGPEAWIALYGMLQGHTREEVLELEKHYYDVLRLGEFQTEVRLLVGASHEPDRQKLTLETVKWKHGPSGVTAMEALLTVKGAIAELNWVPIPTVPALGVATVKDIFKDAKHGTVYGIQLVSGDIFLDDRVEVRHNNCALGKGTVVSLLQYARTVKKTEGVGEYGMALTAQNLPLNLAIGDQLVVVERASNRSLADRGFSLADLGKRLIRSAALQDFCVDDRGLTASVICSASKIPDAVATIADRVPAQTQKVIADTAARLYSAAMEHYHKIDPTLAYWAFNLEFSLNGRGGNPMVLMNFASTTVTPLTAVPVSGFRADIDFWADEDSIHVSPVLAIGHCSQPGRINQLVGQKLLCHQLTRLLAAHFVYREKSAQLLGDLSARWGIDDIWMISHSHDNWFQIHRVATNKGAVTLDPALIIEFRVTEKFDLIDGWNFTTHARRTNLPETSAAMMGGDTHQPGAAVEHTATKTNEYKVKGNDMEPTPDPASLDSLTTDPKNPNAFEFYTRDSCFTSALNRMAYPLLPETKERLGVAAGEVLRIGFEEDQRLSVESPIPGMAAEFLSEKWRWRVARDTNPCTPGYFYVSLCNEFGTGYGTRIPAERTHINPMIHGLGNNARLSTIMGVPFLISELGHLLGFMCRTRYTKDSLALHDQLGEFAAGVKVRGQYDWAMIRPVTRNGATEIEVAVGADGWKLTGSLGTVVGYLFTQDDLICGIKPVGKINEAPTKPTEVPARPLPKGRFENLLPYQAQALVELFFDVDASPHSQPTMLRAFVESIYQRCKDGGTEEALVFTVDVDDLAMRVIADVVDFKGDPSTIATQLQKF